MNGLVLGSVVGAIAVALSARSAIRKDRIEANNKNSMLKAVNDLVESLRQRNALLDEKVQRLDSENEYMKSFMKSAMAALNQPAVFSRDQLESVASFIAGVVVSSLRKPGDLN